MGQRCSLFVRAFRDEERKFYDLNNRWEFENRNITQDDEHYEVNDITGSTILRRRMSTFELLNNGS
jgi:hypothetical protein